MRHRCSAAQSIYVRFHSEFCDTAALGWVSAQCCSVTKFALNCCFIIQQCPLKLYESSNAIVHMCRNNLICRSVLKSILFDTDIRSQKNTKTLRFENLSLRNIEKWKFLVKESSEAFTQLWYPMCCEPTTTFSANSFSWPVFPASDWPRDQS